MLLWASRQHGNSLGADLKGLPRKLHSGLELTSCYIRIPLPRSPSTRLPLPTMVSSWKRACGNEGARLPGGPAYTRAELACWRSRAGVAGRPPPGEPSFLGRGEKGVRSCPLWGQTCVMEKPSAYSTDA